MSIDTRFMTFKTFTDFLEWEHQSRDTIDFKKVYVDMAGDLNAGLMLSELVYWYLPTRDGNASKLRVVRDNITWIAVRRYQWWDRTRLSPDQADRALSILIKAGLVEKKLYKFANEVTVHVRILIEPFLLRLDELNREPLKNPYLPTEMDFAESAKSDLPKVQNQDATLSKILLTETTTESTTEKIPAQKRGDYPKRLSEWKQQEMDRYYTEHVTDLDALVEAWGYNSRFKDQTLTERRLFVQCYRELNDIAFPVENYTSLGSFTRAKLGWKGAGIKPTEMLGMVEEWRNSRLKDTPKEKSSAAADTTVWRTPEVDDPPYPVQRANEQDIPF